MFSVVTASSWSKVKRKLLSLARTSCHIPSTNQRKVEIKNIIGVKARSSLGCQLCKKRRRKCDEQHPTCGLCEKKGVECVYQGAARRLSKSGAGKAQSGGEITLLAAAADSTIFTSVNDYILPGMDLESINSIDPSALCVLEHAELLSPLAEDADDSYVLYQQPSPQLSLFLDDRGRFYVHYFNTHVTEVLCISLANYFLKLFCNLAYNEEAFALAISSWGAFYHKNNTIDNEVSNYLYSSVTKFAETFEFDDSKISLYFKICYYLILVGFNICTGDTHNWDQFMRECFEVINKLGGIEALAREFNFSDEVRFLVSNFQYHDIMSSLSNKHGTLIPMEQYDKLYNNTKFLNNEVGYGIDSLQGCNNPILTVLGYVLELKGRIDNGDIISNEEISVIENKILVCVPKPHLIQQLDQEERLDHLLAFELYRLCCKLTMELYVKHSNPVTTTVQSLRVQMLQLIKMLSHTKFRVIVCLPLLLCGICSYQFSCRQELEAIYQNIMLTCPVPNVGKCWTIVQTSWELNPTGEMIVDWTTICHELGWCLNVC